MVLRNKLIAGSLALLSGAGIISIATTSNQPEIQNQAPTKTTSQTQPEPQVQTTSKPEAEPVKSPVITTKTITETEPIPFETIRYNDASLTKGEERIDTYGQNGILTKTYEIAYSDDIEIDQKLVSSVRTTEPVTQVVAIGTYIAPAPQSNSPQCENGTYTNSAGNTVCRPGSNSNGATALCKDGAYSYSQSRRGTCSGHGGVAQWL